MGGIGEVDQVESTLVPALHHDVASRHRNQAAVMRHAVLFLGLRRGHLEEGALRQLAILERKDRVGAPIDRVIGAALRARPTAPFVREEQLARVVVERRRMPEGKVRVAHRLQTLRVERIL